MMMRELLLFKRWYESRLTRERLLLISLCFAFIYACFNLILLRPLATQKVELLTEIKDYNEKISFWKTQIEALNKISTTPLYKEWNRQQALFKAQEKEFHNLIHPFSSKALEDSIKIVLETPTKTTLVEIKNSAKNIFNTPNSQGSNIKIYQQQLSISVTGNFFDILNYLEQLETRLPGIHWNTLNYQVTAYPIAKAEMEFSIYYE